MKIPKTFEDFMRRHPEVARAYHALNDATLNAGPLDAKTRSLIKLGIAVGSRQEGAVHAHVRKALEAGVSPDEIRHAVILALTTIGFPPMMAAYTWVNDLLPPVRTQKKKNNGIQPIGRSVEDLKRKSRH